MGGEKEKEKTERTEKGRTFLMTYSTPRSTPPSISISTLKKQI
jgi:hypothetical protein